MRLYRQSLSSRRSTRTRRASDVPSCPIAMHAAHACGLGGRRRLTRPERLSPCGTGMPFVHLGVLKGSALAFFLPGFGPLYPSMGLLFEKHHRSRATTSLVYLFAPPAVNRLLRPHPFLASALLSLPLSSYRKRRRDRDGHTFRDSQETAICPAPPRIALRNYGLSSETTFRPPGISEVLPHETASVHVLPRTAAPGATLPRLQPGACRV